MAGNLLDAFEYGIKAGLLLYWCKDSVVLKEKYRSVGKILFFLQAFGVNFWLSRSTLMNSMLYGNKAGVIGDSVYSIWKLVIVFACSFLAMDLLYRDRRQAKLYMLAVFYTVQEMSRFIMHSAWSFTTLIAVDYLNGRLLAEEMDAERFMAAATCLQSYSIVLFVIGYLALMFGTIRRYRRYLKGPVEEINGQGLWFLMLTPIIGMAFDVSWRISFYRQRGTEIEFLYEKYGSMYVVVPLIALLCLICTGFSRKIYSDLMRTEAQKNHLLFYKQQMADMADHVKELEQLYDGIRGMRHDVNNYVADMEQLLRTSVEQGRLTDLVGREAADYLQHMRQAADRLSLQFATGNPVADVILNRKGQICEQEKIALEGDLIYPAHLGIEAFDLGILLNNALDNAIEACRKVSKEQERRIRFRGYGKGRMFFVVVENTYDGRTLREDGDGLRTTKHDERMHGLGMRNMRSCAEKYLGTIQYETEPGLFRLTIMLQGMEE